MKLKSILFNKSSKSLKNLSVESLEKFIGIEDLKSQIKNYK